MRTCVSRSLPRIGWRLAARRSTAEHPAEEIAEIPDVELLEAHAAHVGTAGEAAPVGTTKCVVRLALLRIGEHVVRALHLLEALLRGVVARVAVGVVLARELPVGLLDVVVGRVLRDAEHFVGVPRHSATITLRRPNHAVADSIPTLHDLEHGTRLGAVTRLDEQRLVDVRIERAIGRDLGEPFLAQRSTQRLLDELDTFDELRLLVALGSLERPLQVVEDRQELADEPLVRVRDESLLLARRTLAVVLEVRLDALGEVEVGVALGQRGRERVGSRSLGLRLLDLLVNLRLGELVAHDFAASSSSITSKSASSTTSSSATPSPLPDG